MVKNRKRNNPEKQIENWLKDNLNLFETGLTFIEQQYRQITHYGFNQIDILAKDIRGIFVLIEVKVKCNKYTIPMQISSYVEHFPYPCRGIVAALCFPKSVLNKPLPPYIALWDIKDEWEKK